MIIRSVDKNNINIFCQVLIESARWLESRNETMWKEADLSPEELLKRYDINDMRIFFEDENPVGVYILQWYDPLFWADLKPKETGILHKLAITDNFRGKGLGRKVIESAEDICRAENVKWLRLNCGTHRPRLRNFYEQAGFKMVDRVFIDNRDQMRYVKEID